MARSTVSRDTATRGAVDLRAHVLSATGSGSLSEMRRSPARCPTRIRSEQAIAFTLAVAPDGAAGSLNRRSVPDRSSLLQEDHLCPAWKGSKFYWGSQKPHATDKRVTGTSGAPSITLILDA